MPVNDNPVNIKKPDTTFEHFPLQCKYSNNYPAKSDGRLSGGAFVAKVIGSVVVALNILLKKKSLPTVDVNNKASITNVTNYDVTFKT